MEENALKPCPFCGGNADGMLKYSEACIYYPDLDQSDFLKPCPFCGGEAKLMYHVDEKTYTVECSNCCAMVGRKTQTFTLRGRIYFDSSSDAVEAWNRRNEI